MAKKKRKKKKREKVVYSKKAKIIQMPVVKKVNMKPLIAVGVAVLLFLIVDKFYSFILTFRSVIHFELIFVYSMR